VDEVLAVGDGAFQRKCLDKIRSFQEEGRTIILVTHNLSQVTELADRAILLNRGEVVYDGEPGGIFNTARIISSVGPLPERKLSQLTSAFSTSS